ncbi:hypothetical protein ES705_01673 [subsurface metagenome]|nr:hypothetical protein [Clostridia bacterium]
MKKGIKYLAVLCSVVFLLTILIPAKLFADSSQPTIDSATDSIGNIVTSSFAKEPGQVPTPHPAIYAGDELTFTIDASGSGELSYKFDYLQEEGEDIIYKNIIQDWSTSNTCTWTVPTEAQGFYLIRLQVKNNDGENWLSFCDDYTYLSYYVQADKIQLISVTPPKDTILQRGTEVPFEVKVNYKLESQPKGFVSAGLSLLSGKGVPIGEVEVSQGSGTVVISGLVDVEDLYNWVETDTVYLELVLGYRVSEEEGRILDLKCLTEYPYYIKGEALPVVSPSFKKVLKVPLIPTLSYPNPFVRATITYNLINDNTYEVSKIHFESEGVGTGFIEFFICYQEKYSPFTPVFLPGVAKLKKIIYTRGDINRDYYPSLEVHTNDVIGLAFAGFTDGGIELGTHPLVMLTFIIAKMLRTAIPVTTTFEPETVGVQKEEESLGGLKAGEIVEEKKEPSLENNALAPPDIISPYRPNRDPIFMNEPAEEGTFVFKDIMMDEEGDNVKLQMELKPLNESFTGIPNYESEWVKGYNNPIPLETPPGDCVWNPDYQEYVASISVYLTEGKYHWQLRAIDEHGATSSWSSFDNLNPPIYLIVKKEIEQN